MKLTTYFFATIGLLMFVASVVMIAEGLWTERLSYKARYKKLQSQKYITDLRLSKANAKLAQQSAANRKPSKTGKNAPKQGGI